MSARAPSAYNKFVSQYFARHKGEAPANILMKAAAAEWNKLKASGQAPQPKTPKYGGRAFSPTLSRKAYASPHAGLFRKGSGSFCAGKAEKDCLYIPGCNWVKATNRAKAHCALSTAQGRNRAPRRDVGPAATGLPLWAKLEYLQQQGQGEQEEKVAEALSHLIDK